MWPDPADARHSLDYAGQFQPRFQPAERRFAQGEISAIELGDIAHDGQAQAAPRHGLIQSLATLHGARAFLRGETETVIGHAEEKTSAVDRRGMDGNARM